MMMLLPHNLRRLLLRGGILAIISIISTVTAQAVVDEREPLLWSSTGGGWRAMFADVGFANLFRRAGLFNSNSSDSSLGGGSGSGSSRFTGIATVSGGSWFSTQLFYSQQFYDQAVLAETSSEIEDFVVRWMNSYGAISSIVSDETKATCDTTWITSDPRYDPTRDFASIWYDICIVLNKFQYDWAYFIERMLLAASVSYGDVGFVNRTANGENRIDAMKGTDLMIQTALVANTRVRETGNAVYLGYGTTNEDYHGRGSGDVRERMKLLQGPQSSAGMWIADDADAGSGSVGGGGRSELFTVPLSAAWVVETSGSDWMLGTEDKTAQLQTFTRQTPSNHDWSEWKPFFLYSNRYDEDVSVVIPSDALSGEAVSLKGDLRPPFGGLDSASVVQVAATSSAAGGNGSPLVPSFFTQVLSIGWYGIDTKTVLTVWRVLAGIAAALGTGGVIYFAAVYLNRYCRECVNSSIDKITNKSESVDNEDKTKVNENMVDNSNENINYNVNDNIEENNISGSDNVNDDLDESINTTTCCQERTAKRVGIGSGCFFGLIFGLITGLFYGLGSIIVPNAYDNGVNSIYTNPDFDDFAVCSQWPNQCGETDGFLVDGWFIDNPALVVNIAHHQRRDKVPMDGNKPLKVIITNCNEEWDTTFNRAQILNYFSTYFNQDVPPGEFLWAPGYWAPYRSPQVFEDYLDEKGLDELLEPIVGSNITTALLKGTTVNNPGFGVSAGQLVEMLLINLNENITTFVIGKQAIDQFTGPLASMTSHIALNQVLLERVSAFVSG